MLATRATAGIIVRPRTYKTSRKAVHASVVLVYSRRVSRCTAVAHIVVANPACKGGVLACVGWFAVLLHECLRQERRRNKRNAGMEKTRGSKTTFLPCEQQQCSKSRKTSHFSTLKRKTSIRGSDAWHVVLKGVSMQVMVRKNAALRPTSRAFWRKSAKPV